MTFVGGAIFVGGSVRGNLSVSLNHATNGAFGEVDNHEDVDGGHATGSFADGEFDDPATAQHGMDIFIYKLSINGVPEAIYAADTMPSDGITAGPSENGREGGYRTLWNLANFEPSGDSSSIVAVGSFIGNLTFPMGATGDPTILTNRKDGGNYEAFAVKINGATMQGEWAVYVGLMGPCSSSCSCSGDECNIQGRAIRTTASGDVLVATESKPNGKWRAGLHKLNGATGATIWESEYPGLALTFYPTFGSIGGAAFLGGYVQKGANGTDVFNTGDLVTLPPSIQGGNGGSPVVAKVDADGSTLWAKFFGQGRGIADVTQSVDGLHIYAVGTNEIAVIDGPCTLTGVMGTFLVKLSAVNGACVWATEFATRARYGEYRPVAGSTHVYATWFERGRYGDRGVSLARWSAADGTSEYVTTLGGSGDDRPYGMALGPTGQIILAGRTESDQLDFNGVVVKNLQHQRAEAVTKDTTPLDSGYETMFVAALSHATPPCLECSSNNISEATITRGMCFIEGACRADGDASQHAECLICDAATSQTVEQHYQLQTALAVASAITVVATVAAITSIDARLAVRLRLARTNCAARRRDDPSHCAGTGDISAG